MDNMQPEDLSGHFLPVRTVTPSRLRDQNERAVLSAVRARGALAGAELARLLNISAQTASVITRSLEKEGLLVKGQPIKGKVGKPQMPVALRADGSFAFGLQIGRRGADMILMDLAGNVRRHERIGYKYPVPDVIEAFVRTQIEAALEELGPERATHVVGIGIATPFELWNWLEALGAPESDATLWKDYDFATAFAAFTDIRVIVANDANMACNGELVFGASRALQDFIYLYVGAFIGGGFTLNGQVYHGARGNAGAFGSIPIGPVEDPNHQLIHHASIYRLEQAIGRKHGRPVNLRTETDFWTTEPELVDAWIEDTATALAKAAIAISAVLDVETIILDGGFPDAIRTRVCNATSIALEKIDQQGIHQVKIVEGTLGRSAGAMGAAFEPLLSAHFLEGSQQI